ncbi:MAG: hypothetical protein R2726_08660 [Acidimicrobiales bacterium]
MHSTITLDPLAFALGPSAGTDHDGGLRWTAFDYCLPPESGTKRRGIWRLLQGLDAVKLEPGRWAVPHGADDRAHLDPVIDRVAAAGGRWETRVVGRRSVEDVTQQTQLYRACERVWDGFFNATDRLATAFVAGTDGDPIASLGAIREDFGDRLARDLVLTDGVIRADARLTQLTESIVAAAGATLPPDHGQRAPRLEAEVVRRLDDGRVRAVARLAPLPPATWDLGFAAFEASVYRASPSRTPLQHGLWVITCPADELADELVSRRDRVEIFQRSLG